MGFIIFCDNNYFALIDLPLRRCLPAGGIHRSVIPSTTIGQPANLSNFLVTVGFYSSPGRHLRHSRITQAETGIEEC